MSASHILGGERRVIEVQNSISSAYSGVQTVSAPLQRSQPEPIRVGVIGVGNMGQHHTRVLSMLKDVELVGIADVNVERGIDTASKYRVRFFEDYRDLLLHVDAVCVAVPTRLHHQVGMTCLQAGIHVLIEKPDRKSVV